MKYVPDRIKYSVLFFSIAFSTSLLFNNCAQNGELNGTPLNYPTTRQAIPPASVVPCATPLVLSLSGQTNIPVPAGCTSVTVKVWGAGGGGGAHGTSSIGGGGGGGAFVIATFNDIVFGQSLDVTVGGGGGGGRAIGADGYGGGGGGFSKISRGGTDLIIAGGGGGGGGGEDTVGGAFGGSGGAGGGTNGLNGSDCIINTGGTSCVNANGFGGSQSSGGAAPIQINVTSNATAGAFEQGGNGGFDEGTLPSNGGIFGGGSGGGTLGNGRSGGGGGGGGYYGGGGGSGAYNSGISGSGGGGGSSFAPAFGLVYNGISSTPGNSSDPDYLAPAGSGGASDTNGNPGRVVLIWN